MASRQTKYRTLLRFAVIVFVNQLVEGA